MGPQISHVARGPRRPASPLQVHMPRLAVASVLVGPNGEPHLEPHAVSLDGTRGPWAADSPVGFLPISHQF